MIILLVESLNYNNVVVDVVAAILIQVQCVELHLHRYDSICKIVYKRDATKVIRLKVVVHAYLNRISSITSECGAPRLSKHFDVDETDQRKRLMLDEDSLSVLKLKLLKTHTEIT